jgi:hypothetical protein
MSHVVQIKTQLRDVIAIASACKRLGLATPVHGTTRLYSAEVSGLLIHLKDWQYPIAVDLATGEIQADNFDGAWGNPAEIDRLTQAYAIEKIHLESRRKGMRVTETSLEDGSVKLQILEGG